MTDRKSKKRTRDSSSTSSSDDQKSTKTTRRNSSKRKIDEEEGTTEHEYNKGKRNSSLSSGDTDHPDINSTHFGTKKTKWRRKDKYDREKPKKRKKEKKKKGLEKKEKKKKKTRNEKKQTKQETFVKDSASEKVSASSQIQAFDAQKSVLTESVSKLLPKRKPMVPMTKEEYEKQQAQIRRVYDPETGRNRLVKGTGEILEEIVSKDRHRAINKAATLGDGAFFQSNLGLKDR